MPFVLNEYNRNVSDEELLEDLCRVAKMKRTDSLKSTEYSEYGKYHVTTIARRFGSWNKALQKAGLVISKHYTHNCNNDNITDKELLADLATAAVQLGKNTISTVEYRKIGKHGSSIFQSRFGTWENALVKAGLTSEYHRNITDEELFEEIERVWLSLGRQPTTTDIKNNVSKYSLQSYARRFGGWRGALQAFVNWIDYGKEVEVNGTDLTETAKQEDIVVPSNVEKHRTVRDINLRLRFRVMQRDNFKCCMCGASPATNPEIILHIDHIVPWSHGGETTEDNLQTLCSECNLGKSDLQ